MPVTTVTLKGKMQTKGERLSCVLSSLLSCIITSLLRPEMGRLIEVATLHFKSQMTQVRCTLLGVV